MSLLDFEHVRAVRSGSSKELAIIYVHVWIVEGSEQVHRGEWNSTRKLEQYENSWKEDHCR